LLVPLALASGSEKDEKDGQATRVVWKYYAIDKTTSLLYCFGVHVQKVVTPADFPPTATARAARRAVGAGAECAAAPATGSRAAGAAGRQAFPVDVDRPAARRDGAWPAGAGLAAGA